MLTPQFWDEVHAQRRMDFLGDTVADDYFRLFGRVGAFSEHLKAATTVLDVGPGLGRFLSSLDSKASFALEISENNRNKLRDAGIIQDAWAPGDMPGRAADTIDLSTCLSVLQHCTDSQVQCIFEEVYKASRAGKSFYMNGIQNNPQNSELPKGCGSVSRSFVQVREMLQAAGFAVAEFTILKVVDLPLDQYLIRAVKS